MKKIFNAAKAALMGYGLWIMAGALVLTSCNKFLDKMPDDRAEVNSIEKVNKLLTTAYPECSSIWIGELSSDNVGDYTWFSGNENVSFTQMQEELYRFENVSSENTDSPHAIWSGFYNAVAVANTALAAIQEVGEDQLKAQKAEALLCRAYNMLKLAEIFCMAYDPTKSSEYLGLPYPTKVSEELNPQYERGTLEELYQNIANDIETAIGGETPMLNENHYSVPKYHFNMRAAYAFAARFYLYYQKWDLAVKYASKALGSTPSTYMRQMSEYSSQSTGAEDIFNMYIRSSNNCNFMLMTAYSLVGRSYTSSYYRFNHNSYIESAETYGAKTIFGMSSSGLFYWPGMMYYSGTQGPATFFPKMMEKFEYTDKVASTGYPHIVDTPFTGDETVLVRAEAYTHMGEYQKAIDDLNTWAIPHTKAKGALISRVTLDVDTINGWMNETDYAEVSPKAISSRSIKKVLHPQGFTIREDGNHTEENILQAILHFRRLETLNQGLRFYDIKRYGIEHTHFLFEEDPVIFKAGDLRGAIQIPQAVRNAGIQANPREE